MRRLLLVSNSTMHGSGYLEHVSHDVREHLQGCGSILFVPWALADHEAYADKAAPAFQALGLRFDSIHRHDNALAAVGAAEAVFVGGGNTFRLLDRLQRTGVGAAIAARALDGMPYMGSSAGTNVATLSIRTTNDMPIVQPASFQALGLVPFQINPHFLDADPGSTHMGETREQRLTEFHEENTTPVLGLREGGWLVCRGDQLQLRGSTKARLFRRGQEPSEIDPPADLSFLLDAGETTQ